MLATQVQFWRIRYFGLPPPPPPPTPPHPCSPRGNPRLPAESWQTLPTCDQPATFSERDSNPLPQRLEAVALTTPRHWRSTPFHSPSIHYNSISFFFLSEGFATYICYLHVQAAHRNPVLRVFCQIVHDEMRNTRKLCSVRFNRAIESRLLTCCVLRFTWDFTALHHLVSSIRSHRIVSH